MDIAIPDEVMYIIKTLADGGFESYVVGGCVRDAMLGAEPKDWDICTPALPEQTKQCFKGRHIMETGLKHGTVTLALGRKPYEITTYRIDGEYGDNRRPDAVRFVPELKTDLSRRDFTINAMAYSPRTGLVDIFGGAADLENGLIRCVGEAGERFREDGLRIMRALRFASALGFRIEEKTSEAIMANKALLGNIAPERIGAELGKLLTGRGAGELLPRYAPVMMQIIPELEDDARVWERTAAGVANAPPDPALRLAMLLRHIGAGPCPDPSRRGADGRGAARGGPEAAGAILWRLKYDRETVRTATQLLRHYYDEIEADRIQIKRWLNKIGEKRLRELIAVKMAGASADAAVAGHADAPVGTDAAIGSADTGFADAATEFAVSGFADAPVGTDAPSAVLRILDGIITGKQCYSRKQLAVNGGDLINAGAAEGKEIGGMLDGLLEMVINETAENDKAALLDIAAQRYGKCAKDIAP